jgi:hypothetical protein
MDWVRIASAIKTAIANVTAIFTATGSEPVAGDVDTIENSNKLIYDEIASLGRIITYPIPVEYRTCYEAKLWHNDDADYTVGGVHSARLFYQFATAYEGGAAMLFTFPYRVGSDVNLSKSYIYLYDSEVGLEIDNKWGGTGTVCKFTYDGEFHVYTASNPDTGRYYEYIYNADGTYSRSETVTSIFDYRGMNADEFKMSCVNMLVQDTFKFIPQQIGDTFFVGMGDKGYWFDENYAVTKIVFFGEPILMGHGLNSLKQAVYAIGDSYYRVSMYGKIERFKL